MHYRACRESVKGYVTRSSESVVGIGGCDHPLRPGVLPQKRSPAVTEMTTHVYVTSVVNGPILA